MSPALTRPPVRSFRTSVAVASLVGLVGLTGACGSSTASSASSGSSSSAPIDVMAIGVFQSSALSLPDAVGALKAHVSAVNDAGGVNGRTINLIVCNDNFDPNTAADCARQAVQKKVVAVVSTYEPFSPQVDPVLQAGRIPYVYGSLAENIDGTSSVSFPRDAGVPDQYATLGIELAAAGCTKVGAVVTSLSNTQLGGQWLERGVKAKGAAYDSVSVGQTQADFNAPVAKLLADGADCLVPVTSPDQGPKIVIAAQQSGKKVKLGATTSEFGATALKTLGAAADGMIITGQEYRPTDTQVPAVQEAVNGLKKYQPDVQLTTKFGVAGWAAITALQQVLSSVKGDVTSASVLAAMPTFAPKTGVYADFSFSDKALVSALPQAKNWGYLVWTVTGGSAVLRSPSFTKPSGL